MEIQFKSLKKIEDIFNREIPDKEKQKKLILKRITESYLEQSSFPLYIEGVEFNDMSKIFSLIKKERESTISKILTPSENTTYFEGLFLDSVFDIEKKTLSLDVVKNILCNKTHPHFYSHLDDMISGDINVYANKFCDMQKFSSFSSVKHLLRYTSETLLKVNELDENEQSEDILKLVYNEEIYQAAKQICQFNSLKFISIQNKFLNNTETALGKILTVNNLLTKFLTKIESNNLGMNKIGLLFEDENNLNDLNNKTHALFLKNLNSEFYGSIKIYESKSDTDHKLLLKLEHEYIHALDFYLGFNVIKNNNLPFKYGTAFTELPLEVKNSYTEIHEKMRRLLYLISDQKREEDKNKTETQINQQLMKIIKEVMEVKTMKDTLCVTKGSENVVFLFAKKLLNTYLYEKDIKKVLLRSVEDVPAILDLIPKLNNMDDMKRIAKRKTLVNALEKSLLVMDIGFNTYYKNPNGFAILLHEKEHLDRFYLKKETERLAWLSNLTNALIQSEYKEFLIKELNQLYSLMKKECK